MTFEGDDSVEIPAAMYDSDTDHDVELAPIFRGYRMEAELVRSLLEANDIPAVIFGTGGYAFGAEDVAPNERVMVRSDQVEAALEALRAADLAEGEVVQPTADDLEVMVDDDYELDDEGDAGYMDDPAGVDVLAQGSDWGPRIVGLLGIAALVVAIVVIVMKAGG